MQASKVFVVERAYECYVKMTNVFDSIWGWELICRMLLLVEFGYDRCERAQITS